MFVPSAWESYASGSLGGSREQGLLGGGTGHLEAQGRLAPCPGQKSRPDSGPQVTRSWVGVKAGGGECCHPQAPDMPLLSPSSLRPVCPGHPPPPRHFRSNKSQPEPMCGPRHPNLPTQQPAGVGVGLGGGLWG